MKQRYRNFFLFIVTAIVVSVFIIRDHGSSKINSTTQQAGPQQAEPAHSQTEPADALNYVDDAPLVTHSIKAELLPDPFAEATKSKTATIRINSQTQANIWQSAPAVLLKNDKSLSLKTKKIAGASIRWYQIFPDITECYNNAYLPNEPKAYKWKGVDKIGYVREEIPEFRDQWTISLYGDSRFQYRLPKNMITMSRFFHKAAGSFWYQAEVLKDGRILRSPGIEENTSQGLSPDVFRLTFCRDEAEYIHHLTGFFNVPGIFGSTIRQSTNYIGADCADVLMAAYTKWKKIPNEKNYNVAMLVRKFPTVAEFNLQEGNPDSAVSWNKHVQPGDFIAVRYGGARSYQHIGALYSDKNKNGLLDPADLIIHAGPYPLHLTLLKDGHFDGHVVILRPQ